jgi:adapter protein MecA 1/2
MKIEKISNNQIKCFLNKGDLVSREIKVSELAYGTEKAQELFKDMMHQASNELGFEVENVPLMIEAVPLSTDSIMLIITKVENPEELEDKFTGYSSSDSRLFKKKDKSNDTQLLLDTQDYPITKAKNTATLFLVYKFKTLDMVMTVAPKLIDFTIDNTTLYKNDEDNDYYLVLISSQVTRDDTKVIRGILSEYGEQVLVRKSILSYYDEHYDPIIKDKAIKVLISI